MTELRDDGCRAFESRNYTEERAKRIFLIRQMIDEYASQGIRSVTVRQIYYQFVSRGLASSSDRTYDQVQSDLNAGRMSGHIPWHAVVDRGRGLRGLRTWTSPQAGIRELRQAYKIDVWAEQEWRPEVWVEKAALEGVIGEACSADDVRVDYYATRGYDSQSQQYEAGRRLARYVQQGQRPIVFHLADHDPSGVDMTRDVQERLSMFAGTPVIVQRLGLSMTQIERYNPPPFRVKRSDSRSDAYRAKFGENAWELDALDPAVLRDLIRDSVHRLVDRALWDQAIAEEVEDLRTLDSYLEGDENAEDEG